MFTSILAATGHLSGRDPVVVTAARLAGTLNVPWSIIHVLESASLSDRQQILHFRSGQPQKATADYAAEVRRHLTHLYQDLLTWRPPFEVNILTGFPWEEIVAHAYRLKTDLIVMGPHAGKGDQDGALRTLGRIGSTMEGVVTHESAPVLIINQHPCRPKPAFERVLVGIDFSASCESALEFAAGLSRFFRASLDLFHMLPVPPYPKYSRASYDRDRETTRNRMRDFGRSLLAGVPCNLHIWGGALPDRELIKCAAKCGSDAIVLGSHTKEAQGKWYAGSTVEKTSFQAPCPVFVVNDARVLSSLKNQIPHQAPTSARDHVIRVFTDKFSSNSQ